MSRRAADRLGRRRPGALARRITLSTSGVVPGIVRTGDEIGVMLAISLHAVRDELRDELVPINKKYPLKDCSTRAALSGPVERRRITFEYVMLKGVNDSLCRRQGTGTAAQGHSGEDQSHSVQPWPGSAYECSDWERSRTFADFVNANGYASPIRTPRGRDILAACGQLKSESERMRKKDRDEMESMALQAMMIAGHGAD
jgi:23S rRNA (adenine2503-C2)-methyltransferase